MRQGPDVPIIRSRRLLQHHACSHEAQLKEALQTIHQLRARAKFLPAQDEGSTHDEQLLKLRSENMKLRRQLTVLEQKVEYWKERFQLKGRDKRMGPMRKNAGFEPTLAEDLALLEDIHD